ncbi:HNH endonuclease [Planctomicrobium sp. SH664]|uniref:HNH endonuclease n=1 Tax=Planctomicrobium sp. SH664 TaxID=3448125 RepID=UPI003F5B1EC6
MISAVEQVHDVSDAPFTDADHIRVARAAFRAGVKAALKLESRRHNDGQTCCSVCGEHQKKLNLVRIVPRSRGGDDTADNLALMCESCTQMRNGLSAHEWHAKLLAMAEQVRNLDKGQIPSESPQTTQEARQCVLEATCDSSVGPDAKHAERLQRMCDQTPGGWISATEFAALTVKEREAVTLSLENRGYSLHSNGKRLWIMDAERLKRPVEFCEFEPQVEFGINNGEQRLPHADGIKFTFLNERDPVKCWNMLREFLAALQQFPLDLSAMHETEEAAA